MSSYLLYAVNALMNQQYPICSAPNGKHGAAEASVQQNNSNISSRNLDTETKLKGEQCLYNKFKQLGYDSRIVANFFIAVTQVILFPRQLVIGVRIWKKTSTNAALKQKFVFLDKRSL